MGSRHGSHTCEIMQIDRKRAWEPHAGRNAHVPQAVEEGMLSAQQFCHALGYREVPPLFHTGTCKAWGVPHEVLKCRRMQAAARVLGLPSTGEYTRDLIKQYDSNNDGAVDWPEFVRYLEGAAP
jgi:hypothetical protein